MKRQRSVNGGLRVQGQGRAYAAVIGVSVGMLIAGLAVPLAFGHAQSSGNDSTTAGPQIDPSFASGAPITPGAGLAPTLGANGQPLPSGSAVPGLGKPGATAPGGTTPGSTGPGTGPGGPGGNAGHARLTATDQGVTATTIKVGVVLLDIRALKPLGFSQPHFDPSEQQSQYQVFINQVNAAGGILGRKIVPDYVTYNALDSSGSQSGPALCIKLAENDKVFAAMGVLGGNMDVCLSEQYGIPSFNNTAEIEEAYGKSHNRLVTPYASFERGAEDWGDLTARSGLLKGRKVGTLNTGVPTEALPEAALVKALEADGVTPTYRAHLSSDSGTASSQQSVEIQKMKAAGVNTVFLVTNFIQAIQFVQAANQQNFRPQWMVSDLGSLTAEGLVSSMPKSFDGSYAFTGGNTGNPEPAADTKCRTDFNKATGNHYAAGNESGGTTLFCWMVKVFAAGAINAGPTLTRANLAAATQQLTGVFPHTLPGSFAAGKTDYADYLRPIQYSTACKCYHDVGGPQRGRY